MFSHGGNNSPLQEQARLKNAPLRGGGKPDDSALRVVLHPEKGKERPFPGAPLLQPAIIAAFDSVQVWNSVSERLTPEQSMSKTTSCGFPGAFLLLRSYSSNNIRPFGTPYPPRSILPIEFRGGERRRAESGSTAAPLGGGVKNLR